MSIEGVTVTKIIEPQQLGKYYPYKSDKQDKKYYPYKSDKQDKKYYLMINVETQ